MVLDERVFLGNFEFPIIKGLIYLKDEEKENTDFLFVNDSNDEFSMYFENGMEKFTVPKDNAMKRNYCLFEMKRADRKIYFFCPERNPSLDSVMWYFYIEIFNEDGDVLTLPGQIRVSVNSRCIKAMVGKSKFLEVLEKIKVLNA